MADKDVVDAVLDERRLSSEEEEGDDKLVSRCYLLHCGVGDFLLLAFLVLLVAVTLGLARLGPRAHVFSLFVLCP